MVKRKRTKAQRNGLQNTTQKIEDLEIELTKYGRIQIYTVNSKQCFNHVFHLYVMVILYTL